MSDSEVKGEKPDENLADMGFTMTQPDMNDDKAEVEAKTKPDDKARLQIIFYYFASNNHWK